MESSINGKTIVSAVKFDDNSSFLVQLGAWLASRLGAGLRIVHVQDDKNELAAASILSTTPLSAVDFRIRELESQRLSEDKLKLLKTAVKSQIPVNTAIVYD